MPYLSNFYTLTLLSEGLAWVCLVSSANLKLAVWWKVTCTASVSQVLGSQVCGATSCIYFHL